MIQPVVGFIVYGVHKDGLEDPMGRPFIDSALIAQAKQALRQAGVKLVEHEVVVASKQEAVDALRAMKHDESLDAVILFSGTWVWAAHMVGAVRDFAASGKAILIWTHPGSQGWRPVGGLVLHGGLLALGIALSMAPSPSLTPCRASSAMLAPLTSNALSTSLPWEPSVDAAWGRPAAPPIPHSGCAPSASISTRATLPI